MKVACLTAFASLRGALLFTALASTASAQTQTWIRQIGSTADDTGIAAAADGAGGVYVSGTTRGNLGGPNSNGFSAPWLARYDGAGSQTWIRHFGPGLSHQLCAAAAPDGAGGVYVSGPIFNLSSSYDVWLTHFDSAGNETWSRRFGSTQVEWTNAAASDGAGGVYVSGHTRGSLAAPNAGGADAWLARYDGAGNQAWIAQFGSADDDLPYAAVPDGARGVYVSGYTRGSLAAPNAGRSDAWLAHYDGAGNQTWMAQFGSAEDDFLFAAAPDGAGGVYVGGSTWGNLGGPSAGRWDAWLAHYDNAGNMTWIRQFGTIRDDHLIGAAPDGAGGVYSGGSTRGILAGPNAGIRDAWLAHHDGAGDQTWSRQLGTIYYDDMVAAATDGTGGVYVSGSTDGSFGGPNAGGLDVWLAHYTGLVATRYCTPAISNSTGQPGELTATGSNTVVATNLTVAASQLPPNAFGFFLTSRSQGLAIGPGGSQGNLCLGGAIGRYVGPGQIQNSGAAGTFDLVLDLASTPTPTGHVQVLPGDTWNFQAWYRDANPTTTSNFTDAVAVTFI